MTARETVMAVIAGLLFGAGITVSGVINPAAVLRFLDVTDVWDPSLALVPVGALVVAVPAYALVRRGSVPFFAADYRLPGRRRVDWRLITGAALFGIGWGLVGFSPGTALAAIGTGAKAPLVFGGAMLVGMALYRFTLGGRGGRSFYSAYYARRMSRRAQRAADKASPDG